MTKMMRPIYAKILKTYASKASSTFSDMPPCEWKQYSLPEIYAYPTWASDGSINFTFNYYRAFDTGWWLNKPDTAIIVSGTFEARCYNGLVFMRNKNLHWQWKDTIDANDIVELWNKNSSMASKYVEGILWDILMDKILNTDFMATINWKDDGKEKFDLPLDCRPKCKPSGCSNCD